MESLWPNKPKPCGINSRKYWELKNKEKMGMNFLEYVKTFQVEEGETEKETRRKQLDAAYNSESGKEAKKDWSESYDKYDRDFKDWQFTFPNEYAAYSEHIRRKLKRRSIMLKQRKREERNEYLRKIRNTSESDDDTRYKYFKEMIEECSESEEEE